MNGGRTGDCSRRLWRVSTTFGSSGGPGQRSGTEAVDFNMPESTASERIVHQWYVRPVLFVSDVQAALSFYIDKLGFQKKWHKETVC